MNVKGIDVHRHCIPKRFIEAVGGKSGAYGAELVKSTSGETLFHSYGTETKLRRNLIEPDILCQDIASAGLECALISALPQLIYCWETENVALAACRTINEGLVELARGSSGRVHAMGTLPYQFPSLAVRELEDSVKLGMKSIQFPSNVNGMNLDDSSFYPLFEAAEALGVFIFVHPHPGNVLGQERLKRYYLKNFIGNPLDTTVAFASLMFGGVMDRFPGLKFCFAHGGGNSPYLIGRWNHGYKMRAEAKNLKEVPEFYFKRSYFDTVTHDSRSLRYLVGLVGSEHVVVGSDWPADMGTNQPLENIRNIPLTCAERERIMWGNMANILGLNG